jgi:hypothetical protein
MLCDAFLLADLDADALVGFKVWHVFLLYLGLGLLRLLIVDFLDFLFLLLTLTCLVGLSHLFEGGAVVGILPELLKGTICF